MRKFLVIILLVILFGNSALAQTNPALNMSEVLAYNARFNPADSRQAEVIKNLKPSYLITNLKTDNEKNAFWINVYNNFMLTFLKDTIYEGVYTNFYKQKNVTIAGKAFSLFDIEHEFIRLGKKNKALGFKKSKIDKDTNWKKLRPVNFDSRTILLMYRGLYGYPPFQIIENGDIQTAFLNVQSNPVIYFDWLKPYKLIFNNVEPVSFIKTPFAVQIKNFYPKYEGVKFEEEEKNPWLK